MKGVIDGIIRMEHISLNRAVGFGKFRLSANSSPLLRGRTNTRTHTECGKLTRVFEAGDASALVHTHFGAHTHTHFVR